MKAFDSKLSTCLLAIFTAAGSYAAEKPQASAENAEAILDRLEQRLLEQESQSFSFGDTPAAPKNAPQKSTAGKKADKSLRFEKADIKGNLGETERLKELANLIADLEHQVDQLGSEVQKSKQKILEDAKIKNSAEIITNLTNTDQAAIRSISVTLDGYQIYHVDDTAGLWLPSNSLPLFAGPLQPGNHTLEYEARVIMKHKERLPLNNDQIRSVKQTFALAMPEGEVSKRWQIELKVPTKSDEQVSAVMKNLELVKQE